MLEILAADIRLIQDPGALVAIWVLEQRVFAFCTLLKTIIGEARLASTSGCFTDLLTCAMTMAVLGTTEVATFACWKASSCSRILGMTCCALTAVSANMWPAALADTCSFSTVSCACPIAVTARRSGTDHQV